VHVPLSRGFRGEDYTIKTNLNQPQIVRSLSLPHLSSALAGAAATTLAFAEPFIASDAAVGFWSLFSYRKRTSPRGDERVKVKKDAVLVVNFYYHSNFSPLIIIN
jgi:hypothetical protein